MYQKHIQEIFEPMPKRFQNCPKWQRFCLARDSNLDMTLNFLVKCWSKLEGNKEIKASKKVPKGIEKVSHRYPKGIHRTPKAYPKDIQWVSNRYPKDIIMESKRDPKIFQRDPGNIQNLSARYPKGIRTHAKIIPN